MESCIFEHMCILLLKIEDILSLSSTCRSLRNALDTRYVNRMLHIKFHLVEISTCASFITNMIVTKRSGSGLDQLFYKACSALILPIVKECMCRFTTRCTERIVIGCYTAINASAHQSVVNE